MKLPLQPFVRAFVSQARARSGEPAPQAAADLAEARRLARQLDRVAAKNGTYRQISQALDRKEAILRLYMRQMR